MNIRKMQRSMKRNRLKLKERKKQKAEYADASVTTLVKSELERARKFTDYSTNLMNKLIKIGAGTAFLLALSTPLLQYAFRLAEPKNEQVTLTNGGPWSNKWVDIETNDQYHLAQYKSDNCDIPEASLLMISDKLPTERTPYNLWIIRIPWIRISTNECLGRPDTNHLTITFPDGEKHALIIENVVIN